MHRRADFLLPATAEELGDNHRGARGQAHKEADNQVNQVAGGAAHRRQGFLAHILAHDDGIRGVVQLLEKRAQQNGKEEDQQLLPDDAVNDAVPCRGLGGTTLVEHSLFMLLCISSSTLYSIPRKVCPGGKAGVRVARRQKFFGKGTSHCKRTPKHCKYADFHVKCGQKKDACTIIDAHGGGRGHERL